MKDEYALAAFRYAEHCALCATCREDGQALCDEGLRLMRDFQEAMHADLAREARNRKEN